MAPRYHVSILWFRRDLRLSDHAALTAACAASAQVVPVFVFDSGILAKLVSRSDRRVSFIHASLVSLHETLREYGSGLVVLHGDPVHVIPQLAARIGAGAVFVNRDYETYAKNRDTAVSHALRSDGRDFHSFKDQVIFEGDEVRTGAGTPFRKFTPYANAWQKLFDERCSKGPSPAFGYATALARFASEPSTVVNTGVPELRELGFQRSDLLVECGEDGARRRLLEFIPRMHEYADVRDYPARQGSSGLSVHLRFGTISIRALVRAAMTEASRGAMMWLSELLWREFYMMILECYSHVETEAFVRAYEHIVWPGKEEHFHAWCEGRTGYPIVDAAMRHLNATGWMHNRLRMITAMFLTKDLLVDWRMGEAYFAQQLLDFDLAANNGGWQWCASTGVDAAPYFRVFNPVRQSMRFDADGDFIRENVPELRSFHASHIHWPHGIDVHLQREAGFSPGTTYPLPIVIHDIQKEKAISLLKNTRAKQAFDSTSLL